MYQMTFLKKVSHEALSTYKNRRQNRKIILEKKNITFDKGDELGILPISILS